jgi:exopolyphosphatase/guanosine-5'-triphosphate,3'-diphosphate pyrophosphatase
VVDIGGGSTECIIGEGFDAQLRDSLYMGCIGWSRRFFPEGRIRRAGFKKAELAAHGELQSLEERYRAAGWDTCVGASGTIVAIGEILRANGWGGHGITRDGLRRIRKVFLEARDASDVRLPGLRAERAPILPGGLAILIAVFESLGIERMQVSAGSLREGVLYDLLGRIRHEDARDRTVARMMERYGVDPEQAARVERAALHLFDQAARRWGLDEEARRLLVWAARLHEVGLAVAFSGYHKHGAYLVANADLPGFSRDDQELLAALIRAHRRKVSNRMFANLSLPRWELARRLAVLLRLGALLHRSRSPRAVAVRMRVGKRSVRLRFPRGLLRRQPLTGADLAAEGEVLEKMGFELDAG